MVQSLQPNYMNDSSRRRRQLEDCLSVWLPLAARCPDTASEVGLAKGQKDRGARAALAHDRGAPAALGILRLSLHVSKFELDRVACRLVG